MTACIKALDRMPGCGLPLWAQVLIAAPFAVGVVVWLERTRQ